VFKFDWRRSKELGSYLDAVELFALSGVTHGAAADVFNAVALEPVCLVLMVHLLILSKAGAGDMQQGVFLAAVDRKVVVAALAGIHKLDVYVLPDSLEITVMPHFERERSGVAATLFRGSVVAAAGGMGINVVGFAVGDVDVATVSLPPRLAGRKVLVCVSDAPVAIGSTEPNQFRYPRSPLYRETRIRRSSFPPPQHPAYAAWCGLVLLRRL